MEYNLNQLLEFSKANISLFDEKYEMFLAKPEDLIGKKVISIRSGYSAIGGGQIMIITEIRINRHDIYNDIRLMPCEETRLREYEKKGHLGWSTMYKDRCNSFVFYKP